jgi:protein-S-isoprenylcysteine O-methyltransferase Ste14
VTLFGSTARRSAGLWVTPGARVLVLLQFGLAAWLFLKTPWSVWPPPVRLIAAISLLLVGGGTAMWAWWVMGWSRLRVMPHPDQQAILLRHGPYRFIRHPMYAGLLLATLSCVLWHGSVASSVGWLGLWVVLIWKTHIEERLLREKFCDYEQYASRTWRYFPGLW